MITRKIGVKRFKDKLPNVQWTGLFGEGGENKQYGFEPHVSWKRPGVIGLSVGSNVHRSPLDHPAQRLDPRQRRARRDPP
jgi:hypothetical protein